MPWFDTTLNTDDRVQALLDEMTFDEKAEVLSR
jgi:hypothetical protein